MTGPALLFVHGWGFGPGIWDALRGRLAGYCSTAADLGYFGSPATPRSRGPLVVIGHSLGAMLALADPPEACIGFVAINGFDRFAAGPGIAGVPVRVIERMIARFEAAPQDVLADFRSRAGCEAPFGAFDRLRLQDHLKVLRDGDERQQAADWDLPLLSLAGGADPILPADLRERSFSGVAKLRRAICPGGGHLLPVSHPDWCAEQIRELLRELA